MKSPSVTEAQIIKLTLKKRINKHNSRQLEGIMEIVACIHNALYANAAYSVICNVIQLDKQTIKNKAGPLYNRHAFVYYNFRNSLFDVRSIFHLRGCQDRLRLLAHGHSNRGQKHFGFTVLVVLFPPKELVESNRRNGRSHVYTTDTHNHTNPF